MTTYLVTRHEGTRKWVDAMAKHDRLPFAIDRMLEHLDTSVLKKGDVVVGTLPIHIAAELHAKGIEFWSLDLHVPPSDRGKELSGLHIAKYGARFTRYEVRSKKTATIEPKAVRESTKPRLSISLIPVSEQLAPGAIGWVHMPTDQVRLLASPSMRKKAELLQNWLKLRPNPPKVSIIEWNDSDYATLLEGADDWASKLAAEERPRVVIHLTGGTKPMSMALQRAFGKRADAFGKALAGPYVDTLHGKVEELLGQDPIATPMRSVLNIADLLSLQGFAVDSALSAHADYAQWQKREALFKLFMSSRASSWLPAWYALLAPADWLLNPRRNKQGQKREFKNDFVTVNWDGNVLQPRFSISITGAKKNNWKELHRVLQGELGLALKRFGAAAIELTGDATLTLSLDRRGLDELAFLYGGWMEVWLASEFTKAEVDEWAQGLKVQKGGVENELDFLAACGNRLLLVEVKTGNLTRDGKDDSAATEALYKLDSVAEKLGRSFNERWLVTLKDLNKADLERAKTQNVKVISGADFASLREEIKRWVRQGQLKQDVTLMPSAFPLATSPQF